MKEHKMLRKRSRALGLLMSLTMLAAAVPVQAKSNLGVSNYKEI